MHYLAVRSNRLFSNNLNISLPPTQSHLPRDSDNIENIYDLV